MTEGIPDHIKKLKFMDLYDRQPLGIIGIRDDATLMRQVPANSASYPVR